MGAVFSFLKNPKVIKTGIAVISSVATGIGGFFFGKHLGKKAKNSEEKKK